MDSSDEVTSRVVVCLPGALSHNKYWKSVYSHVHFETEGDSSLLYVDCNSKVAPHSVLLIVACCHDCRLIVFKDSVGWISHRFIDFVR